jgi:HAD superfamily hydrolase (TIGR01490 family)
VALAFFDLDKTVIAKAAMVAFGGELRRRGLVNRRTMVRAVSQHLIFLYLGADEERMAKMRQATLEVTKGWDRNEVSEVVRETLLETVEPIIYAEALDLMEEHRERGDQIYLVSASPEEIVQPLAALLGADGAIASRAEVDEKGCYTGHMAFYNAGEAKVGAIRAIAEREGLHLADAFAYSDSITDLPLLLAVGHPVAVNPDRALAREAKERGWESRSFTNPVRLRDRVTARTPLVTSSLVLAGIVFSGLRVARAIRHRPKLG